MAISINFEGGKKSKSGGLVAIFGPIALALGVVYHDQVLDHFKNKHEQKVEIPYTQFVRLAKEQKIKFVDVKDNEKVIGKVFDDAGKLQSTYKSTLPKKADVDSIFKDSKADLTITNSGIFDKVSLSLLALYVAARVFMNSSLKKKIFREKDIKAEKSEVTFDDIAGIDEIKAEVQEVVSLLKDTDQNKKFDVKTPKGLLLVGGPGNGKTLLAKAIAGFVYQSPR